MAEAPPVVGDAEQGHRLDQAREVDAAWREERASGMRRWLDGLDAMARSGPAFMFLSAVPLLGMLVVMAGAALFCWAFGLPAPKGLSWWGDLMTWVQRGLMIGGGVMVVAARWWRGRLLRRARAEGLELPEPEAPASPEPEP